MDSECTVEHDASVSCREPSYPLDRLEELLSADHSLSHINRPRSDEVEDLSEVRSRDEIGHSELVTDRALRTLRVVEDDEASAVLETGGSSESDAPRGHRWELRSEEAENLRAALS